MEDEKGRPVWTTRPTSSVDPIIGEQERQRWVGYGSTVRHSSISSQYSLGSGKPFERPNEPSNSKSWWHLMCLRCRAEETGPGWEPSFWPRICPHPLCPSYRHLARTVSLCLVLVLVWGVLYALIGGDAAPGGQLFAIAQLVVCAHVVGYLFRLCNLPGLVGMLLVGILFQYFGFIDIQGHYVSFANVLRKISLVIILTRAGLDLEPEAMKRLFPTTLKIGLVPWCAEGAVVVFFTHYYLHMPWTWCLLTACIVTAVSPAVIVPGMLILRSRGYGVAKGIPTVVIAVSGIDDAASVAAFGVLQGFMFTDNSLWYSIVLGSLSLVTGLGFGVLWGLLAKYVPEKGDPFVVPLRVLMLLAVGLAAVFGSELVQLQGAGPLAVVAVAFVSAWLWSSSSPDWHVQDNPVSTAFEIFWMLFEPILFSLTGTQIRVSDIDLEVFVIAVVGLLAGFLLRMLVTVLVCVGDNFNIKEKWFIALACMAKASVQAALAPVVLATVLRLALGETAQHYADQVLMICVLSILLAAPTGAIAIAAAGPHLLSAEALPEPSSSKAMGVTDPESDCHS